MKVDFYVLDLLKLHDTSYQQGKMQKEEYTRMARGEEGKKGRREGRITFLLEASSLLCVASSNFQKIKEKQARAVRMLRCAVCLEQICVLFLCISYRCDGSSQLTCKCSYVTLYFALNWVYMEGYDLYYYYYFYCYFHFLYLNDHYCHHSLLFYHFRACSHPYHHHYMHHHHQMSRTCDSPVHLVLAAVLGSLLSCALRAPPLCLIENHVTIEKLRKKNINRSGKRNRGRI